MKDETTNLDQADEDIILTYTVSDEAIEAVAAKALQEVQQTWWFTLNCRPCPP